MLIEIDRFASDLESVVIQDYNDLDYSTTLTTLFVPPISGNVV